MKSRVMLIRPNQAQSWLKNNCDHNRKLSPGHVHDLANEIRLGRWQVTHQGIAFYEDDTLCDGQHRLAAIVEADTPVEMQVTFDVPVGEFTVVDRGRRRSMGIITRMPDFAAQGYVFMLRLSQKKATKPSPFDVSLLHKHFSNITLSLQDACNTAARFYSSVPIRTGAVVSIAVGEDKDYVLQTYRDLVLGNIQSLPKVALALINIHDRGSPETLRGNKFSQDAARIETYVRARYLFTKSNAEFSKMKISAKTYDDYLRDIHNLVLRGLRF